MMQNNGNGKVSAKNLDQKAIKAALNENWGVAIQTNLELLEIEPTNRKAKMRLGRAYLQTKNFKEAEKLFKEVLKEDPINAVAQKNLDLAKSKKSEKGNGPLNFKKLIKTPGTAEEITFALAGKNPANSLAKGEELTYKVTRNSVVILRGSKVVGKVDGSLAQRLKNAKKKKVEVTVEVLKVRDGNATVIFRADQPVLKSERQDVKPYMKKGSIEEPELELPEEDD